jgi:hypothetical protein
MRSGYLRYSFWQALLRVLITSPKWTLSRYQITFALSKHDKCNSFTFSKTFGYEKYIYECDEAIKYLSKSCWSPHLKVWLCLEKIEFNVVLVTPIFLGSPFYVAQMELYHVIKFLYRTRRFFFLKSYKIFICFLQYKIKNKGVAAK